MLGGVTCHMLPQLTRVPHLHVNRPLEESRFKKPQRNIKVRGEMKVENIFNPWSLEMSPEFSSSRFPVILQTNKQKITENE